MDNLTSTEVVKKYGVEAVSGLNVLGTEMPELLKDYVLIHQLFRELYETSTAHTEQECVDMGYHYTDSRYDYHFSLPIVELSKWNDYPFNLIYPPYPQPEEVPIGSQWCFETLKYKQV